MDNGSAEAAEPDEESVTSDWTPRLRSFVEEATRIAKEGRLPGT